jgi:hypothetical protein
VESVDDLNEEVEDCVDGICSEDTSQGGQVAETYSAKLIALLSRCYDFDSFQIERPKKETFAAVKRSQGKKKKSSNL